MEENLPLSFQESGREPMADAQGQKRSAQRQFAVLEPFLKKPDLSIPQYQPQYQIRTVERNTVFGKTQDPSGYTGSAGHAYNPGKPDAYGADIRPQEEEKIACIYAPAPPRSGGNPYGQTASPRPRTLSRQIQILSIIALVMFYCHVHSPDTGFCRRQKENNSDGYIEDIESGIAVISRYTGGGHYDCACRFGSVRCGANHLPEQRIHPRPTQIRLLLRIFRLPPSTGNCADVRRRSVAHIYASASRYSRGEGRARYFLCTRTDGIGRGPGSFTENGRRRQ
jgi:hypothetical protein